MKCSKCGAENQLGKFCEECGAVLEDLEPDTASPVTDEVENTDDIDISASEDLDDFEIGAASDDVKEALHNLEKYEEGTITHPDDKPKDKRKFWCPQNPMLWSFLWLLLFGLVLIGLTLIFFKTDLGGTEIVFGTLFSVFAAGVIGIDFAYYFPAALTLDKLLKGKGVRLEYHLKKHELIDLAEKAKKRNRGFYLAIGLFGLAFTVYYIYILATATVQTTLMWISLIFSICVFVIFALLFFIMPKFNYDRMMENGSRVIIGNKSVYFGGVYHHWRRIQQDATFGNMNTKKHELEITFTQEFKNGSTMRRKVELYAPDTALKGITQLLKEYERDLKKYKEKQIQNSIVNENKVDKQ